MEDTISLGDLNVSWNGRDATIRKMADEDKNAFLILAESPSWKIVKKYLIEQKFAMLQHAISLSDPIEMSKQLGMAAGMNSAINSITIIKDGIKRQQEKVGKSGGPPSSSFG